MNLKAVNEYKQVRDLLEYIGLSPLELDEQVFIEYIEDNGFHILKKELIIKKSSGKEFLIKDKLRELDSKLKK